MNRVVFGAGILTAFAAAAATFTVDSVKQRYPWNGQVDIDYTVTYASGEAELDSQANRLEAVASDLAATPVQGVRMASFDQLPLPLAAGTHRVTWNAKADGRCPTAFRFSWRSSRRPRRRSTWLSISLRGRIRPAIR